MESVSTLFARNFVRYAYLDASTRTPAATLLAVLNEHLIASGQASTSGAGLVVTEQAGNGHSFKAIESSGLSVVAYAATIEAMLTLYEQAVVELAVESIATPTDLQIRDRMLAILQPRTEAWSDRSCLQT